MSVEYDSSREINSNEDLVRSQFHLLDIFGLSYKIDNYSEVIISLRMTSYTIWIILTSQPPSCLLSFLNFEISPVTLSAQRPLVSVHFFAAYVTVWGLTQVFIHYGYYINIYYISQISFDSIKFWDPQIKKPQRNNYTGAWMNVLGMESWVREAF